MGILDNPEVQDIKIEDCGESLEKLDGSEFILESVYFNWGYSDTEEMSLRSGVIEKLIKAKEVLNNIEGCEGWNLKIWDAFRTLKVQKILYDSYFDELKSKHPDWNVDQLHAATSVFVCPPSTDPRFPSPHNTGGVLDMTLVDENGDELPMGTVFDEFNVRAYTDHYLKGMDDVSDMEGNVTPYSKEECEEFHRNRMLLKRVMEEAGFVNYCEEWWHYSYGDLEWARQKGLKTAIYGSMEI